MFKSPLSWFVFAVVLSVLLLVSFAIGQFIQPPRISQPANGVTAITATLSLSSTVPLGNANPQDATAVLIIPDYLLSSSDTSSPFEQNFPAILTGFFTLLAASFGFMFNHMSNRSTRQYEWGKFLWDKYQQHYLELRGVVRSTLDARVIETKIIELTGKVALPRDLDIQLASLLSVLKSTAPIAQKESARANFLKTYDDFIESPWEFF